MGSIRPDRRRVRSAHESAAPASSAGATLGVIGGGQLGRMFVHAAQRMGYRTAVLDPDPDSPAGLIAHRHIQAATSTPRRSAQLADARDAVTTEFENVPADALAALGAPAPGRPGRRCGRRLPGPRRREGALRRAAACRARRTP